MSWLTTEEMTHVSKSWSRLDDGNSSSYNSWYDPECDYVWPDTVEKVFLCVIYSLIGVIGFVGNFLVVFTIFFKKGSQSVTSMLLCSLAVSDIIIVTIYLPMKVADFLTKSWVLGAIPCKLVGYLTLISPSCSACMLMVIGLERFIVIIYPLRARSLVTKLRAKFIVAVTWIVSLILGVPGLIFQTHHKSSITTQFVCIKDYQDLDHLKRGYQLYGLAILYIIPLIVMGFAYTTVCLRLYASAKTSRGLQSMKAPSSSTHVYSKPPPVDTSACRPNNGFNSPNPNVIPSAVDDDPFSAGSEGRCDTGGRVIASGGPPNVRRQRRMRRPISLKDRQQVILMLILVVVLYAVTWGPLLLIATSVSFGALDMVCMNVIFQVSATCHVLSFLNSAVNPIVYGFMSRSFRETVVEAFGSCSTYFCRGQQRRGRESTYYNSRYSSTTMVSQAGSVHQRGRSTSDGNCSPSRGLNQTIELRQYTRLPNTEPTV